jgi:Dynein heavy chain AAA lid domain
MEAKRAAFPNWENIRFMISSIQYGGRITDDFDQLLMDTLAQKYFHQAYSYLPVVIFIISQRVDPNFLTTV